ncbi:MAG: hypothetical protein ABI563_11885 [Specibacter sp.]
MDGFADAKTATNEELPHAVAVLYQFDDVRLTGNALVQCRRRVKQPVCGNRGRKARPPHAT